MQAADARSAAAAARASLRARVAAELLHGTRLDASKLERLGIIPAGAAPAVQAARVELEATGVEQALDGAEAAEVDGGAAAPDFVPSSDDGFRQMDDATPNEARLPPPTHPGNALAPPFPKASVSPTTARAAATAAPLEQEAGSLCGAPGEEVVDCHGTLPRIEAPAPRGIAPSGGCVDDTGGGDAGAGPAAARHVGAGPAAGSRPRPAPPYFWHLDRHLDARGMQMLLGRVAEPSPTEAQAARLLAAMQPPPAGGGAGGGGGSGGDGALGGGGVLPLHAVLRAVWPSRPTDASRRVHAALERMGISVEMVDGGANPAGGS